MKLPSALFGISAAAGTCRRRFDRCIAPDDGIIIIIGLRDEPWLILEDGASNKTLTGAAFLVADDFGGRDSPAVLLGRWRLGRRFIGTILILGAAASIMVAAASGEEKRVEHDESLLAR